MPPAVACQTIPKSCSSDATASSKPPSPAAMANTTKPERLKPGRPPASRAAKAAATSAVWISRCPAPGSKPMPASGTSQQPAPAAVPSSSQSQPRRAASTWQALATMARYPAKGQGAGVSEATISGAASAPISPSAASAGPCSRAAARVAKAVAPNAARPVAGLMKW